MNTTKSLILLMILLPLLSFSVFAEDTSCELKNDTHNEMSDNSSNEFTRDKKWRLKINDDFLIENADQHETTIDQQTDKPTNNKNQV